VHVSDVSWTERIKNPHEVFKKGEDVTAKVRKIDRRTAASPWASSGHDIWATGEATGLGKSGGKVFAQSPRSGAFVELGENIRSPLP